MVLALLEGKLSGEMHGKDAMSGLMAVIPTCFTG